MEEYIRRKSSSLNKALLADTEVMKNIQIGHTSKKKKKERRYLKKTSLIEMLNTDLYPNAQKAALHLALNQQCNRPLPPPLEKDYNCLVHSVNQSLGQLAFRTLAQLIKVQAKCYGVPE